MKIIMRMMAVFMLIMIALLTIARRDFSGAWIAFATGNFYDEHIALMTGDGGAVQRVTPSYVCAIGPHWTRNGAWIWFESRGCNGTFQGLMQVRPGGSSPRPATDIIYETASSIDERILVDTGVKRDELIVIIEPNQRQVIHLPMQRLLEPAWSPDGEWIAFIGGEPGRFHVYRMHPDGSELQQLTEEPNNYYDLHWSPDGEWLVFLRLRERLDDILRISADGSSLQFLGTGQSPRYAPVAGLAWHPLLAMIVAAGLMILSFAIHNKALKHLVNDTQSGF